jgi:hypothetical protein
MSDNLFIISAGHTMVQRCYENRLITPRNGELWTSLWRQAAAFAARAAQGEGDVLECHFDHEIIRLRMEDVMFVHWQQPIADHGINRTLHVEISGTSLTASFRLDRTCAVVDGHDEDHRLDLLLMSRLAYIAMAAMCDRDGHTTTDQAVVELDTMRLATQAADVNGGRRVGAIRHRTPLSPAFGEIAGMAIALTSPDIAMVMSAKLLGTRTTNGDECPARLVLSPLEVKQPRCFDSPLDIMRAIASSAQQSPKGHAIPWAI